MGVGSVVRPLRGSRPRRSAHGRGATGSVWETRQGGRRLKMVARFAMAWR